MAEACHNNVAFPIYTVIIGGLALALMTLVFGQILSQKPPARTACNEVMHERPAVTKIERWKTALKVEQDPAQKILLCKWIGGAYFNLVFPTSDSYSAPLDSQRKDLLTRSIQYLGQAEKSQIEIDPSSKMLSGIYEDLSSSNAYLHNYTEYLRCAQARCQLNSSSADLISDETVRSFGDLALAISLAGGHKDRSKVNDAYRRSIEYDKLVHGKVLGDYALPAYLNLIGELEPEGHLSEDLSFLEEYIERTQARWGKGSSLLSSALEAKVDILQRHGQTEKASKVRKQIASLEKDVKYDVPSVPYTDVQRLKDIGEIELEYEHETDPRHQAQLASLIGRSYTEWSVPERGVAESSLSEAGKNRLRKAIDYLRIAEKQLPDVGTREELDEVYAFLFTASWHLSDHRAALKIAEKRCLLAEVRPTIVRDETVEAFNDLALAFQKNGMDQRVNFACQKALAYDRRKNRDLIGDHSAQTYEILVADLLKEGQLEKANVLLDEELNRTRARFGKRSFQLSAPFLAKRGILRNLNLPNEAARIDGELAKLESNFQKSS